MNIYFAVALSFSFAYTVMSLLERIEGRNA